MSHLWNMICLLKCYTIQHVQIVKILYENVGSVKNYGQHNAPLNEDERSHNMAYFGQHFTIQGIRKSSMLLGL